MIDWSHLLKGRQKLLVPNTITHDAAIYKR